MRKNGCKRMVFSSSCATYGVPEYLPINEEHPQAPINPYGRSKLIVEEILKDYDQAYGMQSGFDLPGIYWGIWQVTGRHLILFLP